MTTTTAKRPVGAAALPRLVPLAAAMFLALPAHADWRVVPSLDTSLTFTDNIDRLDGPRKHSELVSQVAPGVAVVSKSRRLNLSASAQWHQFAFLHDIGRQTSDNQRSYNGALSSELAEDFLFLDASASRGLHSVSAFGPQLNNDLYALGNRTEIETWRISPYLVHRFGNTANMQLRYTRDSVDSRGRDGLGAAARGFQKSTSDNLAASLASGSAYDTLGWGLNYARQDLDSERLGESSTETLGANLSYRLTPRLALTANAGYNRYDFGQGDGDKGRNWSGGFVWNPSTRTSLQASLGRHYYGKTGTLAASHRSRYTVWSINYGDDVTTSRQQFLLPSTIDTAALLDRLFSTAYPDPIERQRVVAAYIQATGLPPSLADNVNYLSNRYMRQKLLRASAALRRARSSMVLSVYASERTALSDARSDSELLGSQLSSLNTNVRQRGLNASYNYQLNSRTSATASWNVSRTRSLTTGIEDQQRALRVGMNRRYGQRLLGAVDMQRRSGQTSALTGTKYHENAVTASLSMQF